MMSLRQHLIHHYYFREMFPLIFLWFLSGSLCSGCSEFTVGDCSLDPSQIILTQDVEKNKDRWGACEDLCGEQDGCNFWSLSCSQNASLPCTCSLLTTSYLDSCDLVGGGLDTDLEVTSISNKFLNRHL